MTHDPFDTLRSRNPAPPESLPEAPMTVASRISAGHPSLRRGLAIATAAAAVVLMAGGGWLIWSRPGDGRQVVAPTTSTIAADEAEAPPPAWDRSALFVYFLKDGVITPVMRDLRMLDADPLPDLGPLALELLLSGPGAWDAGPLPDPVAAAEAQLTSAIPEGTLVLSFDLADNVAAVDFSAEFAAARPEALAQVVYTLTTGQQVPTAVRFLIEGEKQSFDLTTLTLVPENGPGSVSEAWPEVGTSAFFPAVAGEGRTAEPPLGAALRYPWDVYGNVHGPVSQVRVTLTGLDGTLLWEESLPITAADCTSVDGACGGPDGWYRFNTRVAEAVTAHRGWVTLTVVRIGPNGDEFVLNSHPVWMKPYDEADGPRDTGGATTTTMGTIAEEVPELVVYFLKDDALMPVARDLRVLNVRPLPELGPLALDLLLWGPGAWDAAPLPDPVAAAEAGLTTAIPAGTRLLGLTMEDGVATVDLSAEFAAASPQAIAQVVYTLTGPYLEAEEVRFLIEGAPQVVGSRTSGLFTPYLEPATAGVGMESVGREILSLFLPDVMVENPALGGTLRPGEAVILITRGEDATLTLTAADGTLLWNAWAPFGGEPPYLPPEVIMAAGGHGVWATLRAEAASTDGSGVTVTEIPVWLEPTVPFVDEPDIPEATTTTFGLGEMRPFPADMLTGCAPETARDLASFEAALADGHLDLQDLCAMVGVPDGEVGSGLFIPVYDLDDGSRLYLGYTGPTGDGLLYANLVGPDGTVRHLLEG